MDHEQAVTLAKYNLWANRRIRAALAHYPEDVLRGQAPISYHSMLGLLVHLVDVEWYWREGIQTGNLPVLPLSVEDFNSFIALRRRAEAEDDRLLEYVQRLTTSDLNDNVTYSWPRARLRSRPLWQVFFHIINHGTHHRSELGRYMDTLGRSPGDMDFMKFLSHKS